MAPQVQDPRTFADWEDAFQYPLPVVHKLEQQLRRNVDDNRQKLRSLVGASYRDLLGTAERIMAMDEQMTTVEVQLGGIGQKCNARRVERLGENHSRMVKTKDAREKDKHRAMAQTKIVQNALTAASRTMKVGGDALLVAKVLVLARLLHKSVSEGAHPPSAMQDLQSSLRRLQKKLLVYVKRALVRPSTESMVLANTLCAYTLVSSSAPKDVLRHFLKVRLQQIEAEMDTPSEATILGMLDLYKQTISDTRLLFPRLFADTLSQLTQGPLLDDPQIRSLTALNLDIFGTWVVDGVRTFIPWVRDDALATTDINDALAAWSSRAQTCILEAVKDCIRGQSDASTVLEFRTKVLAQYVRLSSTSRGGDYRQAISDLRGLYINRLRELAEQCAHVVKRILSETDQRKLAASSKLGGPMRSPWELAANEIDLGHGAKRFRHDIGIRQQGRDADVEAFSDRMDEWMHDIDSFHQLIQRMRATRWDDAMDVDLDDIPNGKALCDEICKQDPIILAASFQGAISEAVQWIYDWVQQQCRSGVDSARTIRLLREIEQRRRLLETQQDMARDMPRLDGDAVPSLHSRIAQGVVTAPLAQLTTALQKPSRVALTLWDKSPPLPIQPTPATVRFLISLHKAMSDAGTDLWSPDAVTVVKHTIQRTLADDFRRIDGGDEEDDAATAAEPTTNGHAAPNSPEPSELEHAAEGEMPASDGPRDRRLQRLFDLLYLQRALAVDPQAMAHDDYVAPAVAALRERLNLDDLAHERLQKSADAYWRRTYLLFGLLASS